jgi:hypothetical protein
MRMVALRNSFPGYQECRRPELGLDSSYNVHGTGGGCHAPSIMSVWALGVTQVQNNSV